LNLKASHDNRSLAPGKTQVDPAKWELFVKE
jgi:hypothetical protein